jgi:hypothetical protein
MSATGLYRAAAVLLVLFAAGHTYGFLRFKPQSPEGLAVHDSMKRVTFDVKGKSYSYDGFYTGFGLFISAYLLFSAFLAWHLGSLAASNPQAIGALGWAFFAVQIASLALSWLYFFPPTVVFSALVAICLGWAAWLVR